MLLSLSSSCCSASRTQSYAQKDAIHWAVRFSIAKDIAGRTYRRCHDCALIRSADGEDSPLTPGSQCASNRSPSLTLATHPSAPSPDTTKLRTRKPLTSSKALSSRGLLLSQSPTPKAWHRVRDPSHSQAAENSALGKESPEPYPRLQSEGRGIGNGADAGCIYWAAFASTPRPTAARGTGEFVLLEAFARLYKVAAQDGPWGGSSGKWGHPFCLRRLCLHSLTQPCAVHFIFHASAICTGAVMARILIADDNKPFRTFLKRLLEHHDDWSVCGMAKNGDEAVQKAVELKPR